MGKRLSNSNQTIIPTQFQKHKTLNPD